MWMVQSFHYFYFTINLLKISGIQLSLVDDFDGNLHIKNKLFNNCVLSITIIRYMCCMTESTNKRDKLKHR